MSRPKFTIMHPTARVTNEFEHPWWKAAARALETCDDPQQLEYIIVVHHTRIVKFWAYFKWVEICNPVSWFGRFTVVTNYGRDCVVDQSNAGMEAASGEIFIGNQDDMRFPEHWDTEILKLIPDTSQKIAIKARTDGNRRDLLTIPAIVTRPLMIEAGAVSSEYESMYSDDDWTKRVRWCGKVIQAPHLYFEHLHPVNDKGAMDDVYRQENADEAYKSGYGTFLDRMAQGFPRVPFASESTTAVPAFPTRTLSICIPGESHRAEWELAFFHLTAELSNKNWNVRIHPGYSTNVYQARMGLTNDVIRDAERMGEPEYVLWIDDDNTPSISVVERLISDLDSREDLAGVTGWCWIKTKDEASKDLWMTSCGNFHVGGLNLDPITLPHLFSSAGSLKEIQWSGFPTLLMRYETMQALGATAYAPHAAPENPFGFTGEDISFFRCARLAGLKFAVDPFAKVDHLKFGPIEPDYIIHAGAKPEAVEAVERDREKRNGPYVPTTPEAHETMESLM